MNYPLTKEQLTESGTKETVFKPGHWYERVGYTTSDFVEGRVYLCVRLKCDSLAMISNKGETNEISPKFPSRWKEVG